MSAVRSLEAALTRAVSDLDSVLSASEAWRDDQRTRLERAQLVPLRAATNIHIQALRNLDASLDAAQRLLSD